MTRVKTRAEFVYVLFFPLWLNPIKWLIQVETSIELYTTKQYSIVRVQVLVSGAIIWIYL
jgi:hypothetical protein